MDTIINCRFISMVTIMNRTNIKIEEFAKAYNEFATLIYTFADSCENDYKSRFRGLSALQNTLDLVAATTLSSNGSGEK